MQHVIMKFFILYTSIFHTLNFFPTVLLYLFPVRNELRSFVYVFMFCGGAVITTLMSISDGSDRTFSCRKMGKTRSVREEMDGKVFISRQSRHPFSLISNMIKVLFPICTLIWRVKNYVSRQRKV